MKIWTLWRHEGGDNEMPWMVEAYDEYTADEHNGEPPWYQYKREQGDRELIITIPEDAVRALFAAPIVKGKTSAVEDK